MQKWVLASITAAAVCLFAAGCQSGAAPSSSSAQAPSGGAGSSSAASAVTPAEDPASSASAELESAADALLSSMASGDFAAIADWAGDGTVAFTPYSSVDPAHDRAVTAAELAAFATDTTVYTWGIYDGSGEDIQMTPQEYWERFVWTADFTKASVSVNETRSGGNSIENVEEAYPDCSYVEYYCDGIDPQYEGIDWCALKLVFTSKNGGWQLCGIIHSEWTS